LTTFAGEVRDALDIKSPRDSVDAVHRIVANGLRELDPHAELRRTGYFNHSWAPDFVMRWDAGSAERHIYLRFDVLHEAFKHELDALAQEGPIFLGLVADAGDGEASRAVLPAAVPAPIKERQPLVTETTAVDRLHTGIERRKDARTATRAVVRGGRGHVDAPAADQILSAYTRAVEEASTTRRPEAVRNALNDVERFLDLQHSLLLERVLRSRWIGGGGVPQDFPGLENWDLGTRTIEEIADLVEALLDQPEPVPE
jgi:hypothetical protein